MKLRDYQQRCKEEAARILEDKNVCMIAMQCRLGKTFVSLCTAKDTGARKVLFVTTKKAIPSIVSDYNALKADYPDLFDIKVTNYEDVLAKHKASEKAANEVVDILYPNVAKNGLKRKRLVADSYRQQMSERAPYLIDFDLLMVDECHKCGSFPKMSGAASVLKQQAVGKRVLLMSGTPSPESFSMMYHIFAISSFSPWKEYKSFYPWAKEYVDVKERMINGVPSNDYTNGIEEKIMPIVRPYMVTQTQEEAGFTTKIDERVVKVQMRQSTYNIIKRLKRDRVANVTFDDGEQIEIVAETPAELVSKIHQLASGTIKIGDKHYIIDDSKINWILETFQGHHIAIFYVYKAERDLLIRTLPYVTEDWQEFQKNPKTIFIGQIRSCREGTRMDSAECSIFYNLEYSYTSLEQGKNRIVSKERQDPSIVYFLTSQCRIEELILDCVRNKSSFTTSIYMHNVRE